MLLLKIGVAREAGAAGIRITTPMHSIFNRTPAGGARQTPVG
ncbi:hypothetical protein CPter291_3925 [Collimonas pratensis]|uniref:Uncharacterized protein n=1 Tax=Collimonas pratensis TaxID=279113 RepID=A0ABN4MHP5_9BURK|nr:hypothetical protein CPter291_3925 [Collimonas pratensis]